jgi:hypothetical protein
MPSDVLDPNPQLSWLEDGDTKRKIAELTKRALDMADRVKELPALTAEEIEAERFAYESNAYASDNPLYAAARSASANFLVVPLDGTTPLVDPSEATRDPRKLLTWWAETPQANVGVALGRIGGLFALRVEDGEAWERLKAMAAVPKRDPDTDRSWTEYRHIGGDRVRLLAPSEPFSTRSVMGWGRDFSQAVAELAEESRNRDPETGFLVWSYPSVQSGQDAHDFRSRTIAAGLRVMGEGEVLPWQGSILEDGVTVQAPSSRPPECPLWLASMLGRARSRKVMRAAREAYETTLRAQEAYWMGNLRAQREAGERAMREALAERDKAATALEEAERV